MLEMIALYKCEDSSEDRGRTLFSPHPTREEAQVGNSFLRLILECLRVWSKWFPIDPATLKMSNYKICYEKLIRMGLF